MSQLPRASLGKRLLAIFYDVLITFFLSFIITLVVQTLIIELGLVELESVQISKTESISAIPIDSPINTFLRSLWLIIPFLYFVTYWTKRGRTLGMKVWKIKIISSNQLAITWLQSAVRFFGALFGLVYLWMVVDKNKLPLQDRVSKTRLIKIE
jgi:uncharacterized RDD family membrane protein YckC